MLKFKKPNYLIVPLNNTISCKIHDMLDLSTLIGIFLISILFINMEPSIIFVKRNNDIISVDLPLPILPQIPSCNKIN